MGISREGGGAAGTGAVAIICSLHSICAGGGGGGGGAAVGSVLPGSNRTDLREPVPAGLLGCGSAEERSGGTSL